MKKFFAILVAVMLVACLVVPALAAENTPSVIIGTELLAGENTTIVVNENEEARQTLDEAVAENGGGTVLYLVDVTVSNGNVATMKFPMPAGKKFGYVLHWESPRWEKIEASYADGTLTATNDSWSPVAVVVADAAATDNNTSSGSTGNNGATPNAPRTGEAGPAVAVALAALTAAAAGVFFAKSRKAA